MTTQQENVKLRMDTHDFVEYAKSNSQPFMMCLPQRSREIYARLMLRAYCQLKKTAAEQIVGNVKSSLAEIGGSGKKNAAELARIVGLYRSVDDDMAAAIESARFMLRWYDEKSRAWAW